MSDTANQTPTQVIVPLQKAGRCVNGFENDHGSVVHAVPNGIEYCRGKALCGTEPGRRSVGWVKPYGSQDITCARCLSKLAKATGKAA